MIVHFAENTDNKKTKMLFQGNSEQKQGTKHFWGNSSHFLAEKKQMYNHNRWLMSLIY